jgi:hypothetical protein
MTIKKIFLLCNLTAFAYAADPMMTSMGTSTSTSAQMSTSTMAMYDGKSFDSGSVPADLMMKSDGRYQDKNGCYYTVTTKSVGYGKSTMTFHKEVASTMPATTAIVSPSAMATAEKVEATDTAEKSTASAESAKNKADTTTESTTDEYMVEVDTD